MTTVAAAVRVITIWTNLISGLGVVIGCAMHIRQVVNPRHYEVNSTEEVTQGPLCMIVLCSIALRLAIDMYQITEGVQFIDYLSDATSNPFFDFAKDLFSQMIPIILHLYSTYFNSLYKKNDDVERATKTEIVEINNQMVKLALRPGIIGLHFASCGYVIATTSNTLPLSILVARVGAFWIFIDYCLLLTTISSPILQIVYRYFHSNVSSHAIHKIHFHRTMAINLMFAIVVHVTGHIVTWSMNPNFRTEEDNVLVYTYNIPIVTGFAMLLTIGLTLLSGFLYQGRWFYVHIPLALITTMFFYIHGYQRLLGPPVGDRMVMMFSVLFGVIAITHADTTAVKIPAMETTQFLLLESDLEGFSIVDPGCYYTLYLKGTYLSHGHQFSAFVWPWSDYEDANTCIACNHKAKKLRFIIRTKGGFTQSLSGLFEDKNSNIQLAMHGPYLSTGNSALRLLETMRIEENEFPILALYANGVGITVSLSLLQHLLSPSNRLIDRVDSIRFYWSTPSKELCEKVQKLLYDAYNVDQLRDRFRKIKFYIARIGKTELNTEANRNANRNADPPVALFQPVAPEGIDIDLVPKEFKERPKNDDKTKANDRYIKAKNAYDNVIKNEVFGGEWGTRLSVLTCGGKIRWNLFFTGMSLSNNTYRKMMV
ncbi:hypothetical protein PPL_11218 [Heterostelium album PN500]|uniref:Ferric reductase NAD binding domain-containing protein n=1 Tax=Heterostelium pallidum (strain ATCC 26659 / Pp 5 / PN500) TaxID=670386 RepID=D3BTV8_HETP5|nr:hypothetical protein PPL_11218 [Heterostelium album PN500]EFA75144.1 hypothetical protein PPL_11218 [Heterostelium album PN500]|eukprot:XP_020427278.1 hypothetical protein PPL_11218 [Heterostelium album PN500]